MYTPIVCVPVNQVDFPEFATSAAVSLAMNTADYRHDDEANERGRHAELQGGVLDRPYEYFAHQRNEYRGDGQRPGRFVARLVRLAAEHLAMGA
jgi:hypothetical protein